MSDVYTLTLNDINSSANLRNKGALAGDTIVDGSLSRVFSKDEDAITSGYILTASDVANSPNLQSKGAQAGERIVDGKYVSSERDDAWTQFKYAYDKAEGLISNTAAVLEARFPFPEFNIDFNGFSFVDKDDKYGEGYNQASPDERREMLLRQKERELQEEYGQFFEEDEGSLSAGAGGLVGSVADVSSLAPIGTGYKTMAGISGLLGLTYSATEDLAQTGEVDPAKAIVTAAASAVAAPAMVAGARYVGGKVAAKNADKLVTKAQNEINDSVAKGIPADKPEVILQSAGINPAKVQAALSNTGKQLRIPASATRAQKAIDEAITNDSAFTRTVSQGLDKYLGTLSTRIRNVSEPVFARLRAYEFEIHLKTQDTLNEVKPFLTALYEQPTAVKNRIAMHLYNGNTKAAEGLMQARSPELLEQYTGTVKKVIERTGEELKESGFRFTGVENYFPRLVKDYQGLRESLGKEKQGLIDKALSDYAKKKKISVSNLNNQERSEVIDLTLRGYRMATDGPSPRFIKPRTLQTIQPEQMKYYADAAESLSMYLRGSVDNVAKRKFFGRSTIKDDAGLTDLEQSVGKLIDDEMATGAIPRDKQDEIITLLKSRFVGGEQSPSKANTLLRNTGYMGTIANPLSAITQLADVAQSNALYGFRNTIASMFGTKEMKLIDVGLENVLTKELGGDVSKSGQALSAMLKAVGFSTIDRLGKETLMNAALKSARKQVKTPKGEAAFRKKHQGIYGNEIDSLVADLKAGSITPNVKMLSFNNLADIQPVALSEMPQGYLDNPNWRILYMLKSFTLKQYDIVRRNIVQEWKKGNKVQATKQAALLAGYLTAANTGVGVTKDILNGREVRPEDLPEKALWALLGVFGLNKYTAERYLGRGDIKGAALNTLLPATPLIEAAWKGTTEVFEEEPDYAPVLKGVPVVGPLAYNWFGGGAEKYNERLRDSD